MLEKKYPVVGYESYTILGYKFRFLNLSQHLKIEIMIVPGIVQDFLQYNHM